MKITTLVAETIAAMEQADQDNARATARSRQIRADRFRAELHQEFIEWQATKRR